MVNIDFNFKFKTKFNFIKELKIKTIMPSVMTLPSLGIASATTLSLPPPCLLQLGCRGQREVINS
jgi:hypothetical protein